MEANGEEEISLFHIFQALPAAIFSAVFINNVSWRNKKELGRKTL